MNEISPHIGREQEVTANGRTWKVARWDREVWWKLLQWARGHVSSPLDLVSKHLDRLCPEVQKYAVDRTLEKADTFLSINSELVQSIVKSLEGSVRILWLLLTPYQPAATEDDAFQLVADLGPERLDALFGTALGKVPEGKAQAPAGT